MFIFWTGTTGSNDPLPRKKTFEVSIHITYRELKPTNIPDDNDRMMMGL